MLFISASICPEDAMEALPKILSEHERSMEGRGASSLASSLDLLGLVMM